MASRPKVIINISSPTLDGMLRSFGNETPAARRQFTKGDGNLFDFLFVEETGFERTPFRVADLTGYTIESAIGSRLNDGPSAGTFTLTFGANTTSALAYNASESDVSTALNALASVISAGGLTVTKSGQFYRITFTSNGARSQITSSAALLTPTSVVPTFTITEGDASTKEVQGIRVLKAPLAYTSSFSAGSTGAANVTRLQAGDATHQEIQRVALDVPAYDGSMIVSLATSQEYTIRTIADVSGSLHETGWITQDEDGTVGIWIDEGSGTAPAEILDCDRQLAITTIGSGDSAATVATKIATAVDADSSFAATSSGRTVTVRMSVSGARNDPDDVGTTFTFTTTQTGTSISGAVPSNATSAEFSAALGANGRLITVLKSGDFQWDLTFVSLGSQSLVSVDASALFQTIYTAAISLNNQAVEDAFADEDGESIDADWEFQVTPPGQEPITIYSAAHTVYRDVITNAISAATPLGVGFSNFLTRVENIDLTAMGHTTVFTVPNGKEFIVTGFTVIITDAASVVDSSLCIMAISRSSDGGSLSDTLTLDGAMDTVGKRQRGTANGAWYVCPSGYGVRVSVATGADATTLKATVVIEGFYEEA